MGNHGLENQSPNSGELIDEKQYINYVIIYRYTK